MRRALYVGVTVLVLTGCGGSTPSKPDRVVRDFFVALAQGDGGRACGYLTTAMRAKMAHFAAGSQGSCEATIQRLAARLPAGSASKARRTKWAAVVRGERATVSQAGVAGDQFTLIRDSTGWHISKWLPR